MGKKELNLAQLDRVNGGSAIDEEDRPDRPSANQNNTPRKVRCKSPQCHGELREVVANSGGRLVCKTCGKPIDEFQHSAGFLPGL